MDILLCMINGVSWEVAGKVAALLFVVSMVVVVIKWHINQNNQINLAGLFLDETGKIGSSKMRLNGAWILFSWVIIYSTLSGHLSEWMSGIYIGAFVFDRMQARKEDVKPTVESEPAST